ncbi:Lar family restriction alleviation protein [Fodinibius sp. SL11]|uniref:Lar family restriction alleviation protein n=1 Tax=Fodinibius sp. SL11 TaxID=3425690 RepID=UPI003F880FB7
MSENTTDSERNRIIDNIFNIIAGHADYTTKNAHVINEGSIEQASEHIYEVIIANDPEEAGREKSDLMRWLACPFCGEEPRYRCGHEFREAWHSVKDAIVECDNCGLEMTEPFGTPFDIKKEQEAKKELIARWNKRVAG